MWKFAVALLLTGALCGADVPRLAYATFLSGNYGVTTFDGLTILPLAVADSAGNTYVADTVLLQSRPQDSPDVLFSFDPFVMKIAADGKSSGFVTHVKGQIATGLALGPAGNIYLVGGLDPGSAGFVAKLAPDGSILYNIAIPALPLAVAADATGAAYVTGTANASFQTTPGAYKTAIGAAKCPGASSGTVVACSDAFVAKISSDGKSTVFATLLGGSANDSGQAIAIDPGGSVIVAGQTFSADFPATPNAFQAAYGGGGDGFLARLDPAGRTLSYATFIGGSGQDSTTGMVLDSNRNVYLTGSTESADFPVMPGTFQPAYGGAGDTFFLKLSPLGQAVFSSYLGGSTMDTAGGIAMNGGDRFYLAVRDNPTAGSFVLQLDQRSVSPCGSAVAIVAVDAASGNVVDHYALRPFGVDVLGPEALSIDGAGLLHVVGRAVTGIVGNSFAVTPGVSSAANRSFLARVNFSGTEVFAPACLVNAANFDSLDVSVAPGEILSLFGVGLGPPGGLAAPDGTYPTELGGTQILVGDTALPLFYVSESQVNAVAPYSLRAGPVPSGTNLTVVHGSYSVSYAMKNIWPAWPGFFTAGGFGSDQVAALNQDGSTNGPDHPAATGSVVSLFATGLGKLTDALPDDVATPLTPPWPGLAESFQAYIAGTTPSGAVGMEVLYAGPAPGKAPGVYQVNVRIPDSALSGEVFVRFIQPSACDVAAPCLTDLGPYLWIQPH